MSSDLSIPAILGGAYVSKEIVLKVLGPTSEYLGEGLRQGTEKAFNNVGRVFASAVRKLGPRINDPGGVPPRVLKGILQEAPFADDQLTAEYFGGVLASSRSEMSRDDRGATVVSLIGRLSTYQIRAHYVLYQIVRSLFVGQKLDVGDSEGRDRMETFVPSDVLFKAMAFDEEETKKVDSLISHLLWGIHKESLIHTFFGFGDRDELKMFYLTAPGPGMVFAPSGVGVELFMWAYGHGDKNLEQFLKGDLDFAPLAELQIPLGSRGTKTA